MQMEHNMARNPNWWEANKLAMLQVWLPEDLNSGPSAYKSTVLFFFYMFVILDILPNSVIYQKTYL